MSVLLNHRNAIVYENRLTTTAPTSLGKWAILVAQTLDSYGLDSQQIFLSFGVSLEYIKKNNARLPCSVMKQIWQRALELSQDNYLALRVASLFIPAAFSTLGLALSVSENLFTALQRACCYSQFISNDATVSLLESDNTLTLKVDSLVRGHQVNFTGQEAIFTCLITLLRSVAGDDLKIKGVYFKHAFCWDKKPFEVFFNCPVYFSSSSNQVVFEKEKIIRQPTYCNTQLREQLDKWVEQSLSHSQQKHLSPRVKSLIEHHISQGECHLSIISSHMAMSTRVMQRRLKAEGTSYSALLDECRHSLAIKLVTKQKHSLTYVSELLDFNNSANFTRAFKRWTGITPQAFRNANGLSE